MVHILPLLSNSLIPLHFFLLLCELLKTQILRYGRKMFQLIMRMYFSVSTTLISQKQSQIPLQIIMEDQEQKLSLHGSFFLAAFQRRHLIPYIAIRALLKFLWTLLKVLSPLSVEISHIFQVFPTSFYAMLKFADIKKDDFTTYLVCPNPCCCALYKYDDCIDGRGEHR